MTDRRGGPRLAPEPFSSDGIPTRIEDHLDGNRPVKTLVVRRVDHAHPALTQFARDAVVADLFSFTRHAVRSYRTTARTSLPTVSPWTMIEKMTTPYVTARSTGL